jgi:hypothetical protein
VTFPLKIIADLIDWTFELGLRVLTARYAEIQHKTATLQETIQAEILRHMDIIIRAKTHTEQALKAIRACAETQ